MGGMGLRIAIRRTSETAIPLLELHRKVWDALEDEIRAALRDERNRVTTADYLLTVPYEGLQESGYDAWNRDETELWFSFSDKSGCCSLSMNAGWHWTRLAYGRTWESLGGDGWAIEAPPTPLPSVLVRGPSEPIVYVEQGMFAVFRRRRGRDLGDDGYGRDEDPRVGLGDSRGLRWSELAAADRDRVELAALTGQCQCDVCARCFAAAFPTQPRLEVASAIGPVRRAWEVLDTGTDAQLEANAATAVGTWDWTDPAGPPPLGALRDHLAARDVALAPYLLAGVVANRAREA